MFTERTYTRVAVYFQVEMRHDGVLYDRRMEIGVENRGFAFGLDDNFRVQGNEFQMFSGGIQCPDARPALVCTKHTSNIQITNPKIQIIFQFFKFHKTGLAGEFFGICGLGVVLFLNLES